MSRQAVTDIAQETRSSYVDSGRQGNAGAGNNEQAGRGRSCAEIQNQSIWLWEAGNRRSKQS